MNIYLFIIDYDHLDNGMFLKELAKTVALNKIPNSIFIHGDSEYTNRIMQLGTMREDATLRSTKELNHRLTALLADEGVAVSAFNGNQKNIIINDESSLNIDSNFLKKQLTNTHVLLSNLAINDGHTISVPLTELAASIMNELNCENGFLFTQNAGQVIKNEGYIKPAGFEETDFLKVIDLRDLKDLG